MAYLNTHTLFLKKHSWKGTDTIYTAVAKGEMYKGPEKRTEGYVASKYSLLPDEARRGCMIDNDGNVFMFLSHDKLDDRRIFLFLEVICPAVVSQKEPDMSQQLPAHPQLLAMVLRVALLGCKDELLNPNFE
ncbi:hypothetical protein MLD38_037525 [Melastoma candidum]|uniref:Uncharacterized protein n=1 Tax=Melastoma candidum TaxID=119954 RepID=A0ACB9LNC0_9MYRT|nr:hypothetical protein MLD38_037525 [Melastoma candidum]